MLGTYVAQPARGHAGMEIGLAEFRDHKHLKAWWMLANPWLRVAPKTVRAHAVEDIETARLSWSDPVEVIK